MNTSTPAPCKDTSVLPLDVVKKTQDWVERAVIGLNLCPFVKSVHAKGQIHYAVTAAVTTAGLLEDLRQELTALAQSSAHERDTTLLMLPHCLQNFLDFNDFLQDADTLLEDLKLDGNLQIASFHPQYQFAGTEIDDVTNCTNRSPYPTLHLLREESIDRAVQAFPEASAIYERNMETMKKLGMVGWHALNVAASKTRQSPLLHEGDS